MNGDPNVTEAETAPTTRARTGVAIGILIVTLLALAFYFYWRTTGMQEGGRRPPAPREISSLPEVKSLRMG
jgi:hypothetical protein